MKLVTLIENTTIRQDLHTGHGLSLYLETPKHKILFDMGPNADYLENAEKLGVDLTAVDIAILSHGHYDHSGGLEAFCRLNDHAKIYLRKKVFGDYYSLADGAHYIGVDPDLKQFEDRFVYTDEDTVIDEELHLFSGVEDHMNALAASGKLKEKTAEGYVQDQFTHEQDLIVTAEGKTVLFAGCAHMGVVNIMAAAEARLGKKPDVVVGGFHYFQMDPEDPASGALLDRVGKQLLAGDTVYYSGHCTGEYAFNRLHGMLGDRLRPMQGGVMAEL